MRNTSIIFIFLPLFILSACGKETSLLEGNKNEKHEKEISVDKLPVAVRANIQARFEGSQLIEADEMIQQNGQHTYDIEIKHAGQTIEVMYDAKGGYLGQEDADEDDDEDEGDDD